MIEHLISFHKVTGCDTSSFISGHTKKTTWKVLLENPGLLADVGVGIMKETFSPLLRSSSVDCIVNFTQTTPVDAAIHNLFSRGGKLENVPPTNDALLFRVKTSPYQVMVWRNVH